MVMSPQISWLFSRRERSAHIWIDTVERATRFKIKESKQTVFKGSSLKKQRNFPA